MSKAIIETAEFNRLVNSTKGFVGTSSAKPQHQWIRLEIKGDKSVIAIAVDGYKMSVERAECVEADEDFIAYVKPTIKKFKFSKKFSVIDFVTIELINKNLYIAHNDDIIGYRQPEGELFDWEKVMGDLKKKEAAYKVSVNPEYLKIAMQSLEPTNGTCVTSIIEFRSATEPVLIRVGRNSERIVLPVRVPECM